MMPVDFGTLPQQVTAISTGGIFVTSLGLLLKWNLGRGSLAIEAQKQDDEAEANIRDHYARELARLTARLADTEERYRKLVREAEEDRDKMRQRIAHLEDEIKGLVRLITYNSAHTVLQLGDEVPEDIRETAVRVQEILAGNGNKQ